MKKQSKWKWYGVKIIKQIVVDGEPNENLLDEFYDEDDKQLFEETLMLVRAQSSEHAYKIAKKNATKDEFPYPNKYEQQVTWKFVEAVDCYEILDELKSGAEIYSCLHTTDNDMSAKDFLDKYFKTVE